MQKEKLKVVNKKGCHAELVSASHLVTVLESGEILKQVQDDNKIKGAFYEKQTSIYAN